MAEQTIKLDNGDTIIYELDRRNTMFYLKDLYKYRMADSSSAIVQGTGKWIPNEDDMVYDFANGLMRVSRQDLTDYHVDLVSWDLPKNTSDVSQEDVLVGVGPGTTSESYRVYIDTRTFPYGLDINGRLKMYGAQAKEVRVFRGTDISETGEVVSAYYNQSGDYISDAIPMVLAETTGVNISVKAPIKGFTSKLLNNGDVVTVVSYSDTDTIIDIAKMLVHRTNIVRHAQDADKRIVSIEVISPYLSKTEPNRLEVPINSTAASLAMQGKVTYNDGSTAIYDIVDETANGKMKLLGFQYWSPSISGRPQDMMLTYTPAEGEYSYLQGETGNGDVTQPYTVVGLPSDPAYSLKLFAFPTWVSSVVGYTLEFWMYDLTRAVAYRVPKSAIELVEPSPSFDGLNYLSTQYMTFAVNLNVLDAKYGTARHVQQVQISLLRDGSIRQSNWKLKFAANQQYWYGDTLEAVVKASGAGLSTINIGQGQTDQAVWLQRVFYNAEMLYDPQTENVVPTPTHFVIMTKTRSYEVPLSQWAQDVTFINDMGEGATVYVKWIRRLANTDLQLGVSGIPLHNA